MVASGVVLVAAACHHDAVAPMAPGKPGNPIEPTEPVKPSIASVQIAPRDTGMVRQDTLRFTATVYDETADTVTDLSGHAITWSSSNQQVATISLAGVLTAVATGTTTVSVQIDSLADTTQLQVFAPFDSVSQLSVGPFDSCAIRGNPSRTYCWGWNVNGDVGNGTVSGPGVAHAMRDSFYVYFPSPVVGSQTFVQVSAGYIHTCAIATGGSAYCWGDNEVNQLGDGTTTARGIPTPVLGGLSFKQVSASRERAHSCAVTPNGAAYCWGRNGFGQLGDSSEFDRATPTLVKGKLSFAQVSAGAYGSCGLTTSGALYCWGSTLGNVSDYGTSPTPVTTQSTFTQVSASEDYRCALATGGTVYCWGENWFGQLGDGTTTTRLALEPVSGHHTFTQVVTGWSHTCALTSDGTAYCWGDDSSGQLGDGNAEGQSSIPVQVSGGLHFRSLSADLRVTCGITADADARVYCWGSNVDMSGTIDKQSHSTPVPIVMP
ncbi:MAG TPA: Ig-like domain-containing protein [Gemmatimonadaceae bacterium]|nr:Ig-like domain-containing protein [Gemmatimonadaceae bacterium]